MRQIEIPIRIFIGARALVKISYHSLVKLSAIYYKAFKGKRFPDRRLCG